MVNSMCLPFVIGEALHSVCVSSVVMLATNHAVNVVIAMHLEYYHIHAMCLGEGEGVIKHY